MTRLADMLDETEPLPTDAFTLADRDFCSRQAEEFRAASLLESARSWAQLATKIEKVLVHEYVEFTRTDAHLIQALHVLVMREPLKDGNKARSRLLSRLGLLVVSAERGTLRQLRVIVALVACVLLASCSHAVTTEPAAVPIGPGCELGAHVPAAGGFPAYNVWAHYPLCPAPSGATTYEGKTVHWDGAP